MVGEQQLQLAGLRDVVVAHRREHKSGGVLVRADPKTRFGRILEVVDAVKAAGVETVGIARLAE